MRKTRMLAMVGATALTLIVASAVLPAAAQVKVDSLLTTYRAVPGVSGNLSSVGSDTLNNLMTLWAEGFNKFYPNVRIQIEGKGSSTAPPALIAGTAQLGPMSRPMRGSEIDQFERKYGFKPTELRVAVDALAVFVNKDNPIKCLTLAQTDAIFSKSRRAGHRRWTGSPSATAGLALQLLASGRCHWPRRKAIASTPARRTLTLASIRCPGSC